MTPFSSQIEALQVIVKRLESEPMPLEEAMALFEEGMKKAADCRIFLEQARQKVILLTETEDGIQGKAWNPLNDGES
ncbi:MAG: exodeoxyribonuclease VII small subunit [Synergistales bacterium]|jgi:exodeoxyribonuclease VII small subunit